MNTRRQAVVSTVVFSVVAAGLVLVLVLSRGWASFAAANDGERGEIIGVVRRPLQSAAVDLSAQAAATTSAQTIGMTDIEIVGPLARLTDLIIPDALLPPGCTLAAAVKPNPLFLDARVAAALFTSLATGGDAVAWATEQAQLAMYREDEELGVFAYRFADTTAARDAAMRLVANPKHRRARNTVFLAEEVVVWLWDDGASNETFAVFDRFLRGAFAAR